jgi:hypothetical protein
MDVTDVYVHEYVHVDDGLIASQALTESTARPGRPTTSRATVHVLVNVLVHVHVHLSVL